MSEDGRAPFGDPQPALPPRAIIIADSPATARLIEAAGWQATGDGSPASAASGAALIHAFDWREHVPGASALEHLPADCGQLCLVSLETIDRVDALPGGRPVRHVFGDAPALIATELSDLSAFMQTSGAFDSKRDERARLQSLAMELARLAEQLGSLSTEDDDPDSPGTIAERSLGYSAEQPLDIGRVTPPDPQRIRHLITIRRLRDRFFSAELFADPAWDILLDLAASRLERRPVSVSSLCIAAAVPPTTALRWIRMMTDQDLLVRRADPDDARRMFVALSDSAFDQLCSWFALVEARGGFGG